MPNTTNTPELSPQATALANQAGSVIYRLAGSLLGVSMAYVALETGWGMYFPLLQVWGLLVLSTAGLGYISRKVSYGIMRGKGQASLKNFLDLTANGVVQVQQADVPAAPDKAPGGKGPGAYL